MAATSHRTSENPNERYGVRACSAVGQQKHSDCAGEWTELLGVRLAGLVPLVVICDYHLAALQPPRSPIGRTHASQAKRRAAKRTEEELIL